MSMMMKLINAAAGQSVGDEIYYVSSTTNSFRLVKIDFDAETVTVGTNKANGEYADASGQPSRTSYAYTGNSNAGACVVGNDGYLYAAFKSDLDDNFANAQGGTSILMRWNMKTLEPDPGYFYNLLARDTSTNSTLVQNIQEILYHEPSQTMSVVGTTEASGMGNAIAYSFKIFPWPTTAIDALGSGAYHSTSNPNGRTLGTFLDNTNSADSSSSHNAVAIGSGTTAHRLHLMSNGKDQLGVTTMRGSDSTSTDFMAWKRAYDTNGVGRSYESFNVGGSNFTYEMTTAENPWLEMTGFSIPYTTNGSWKSWHNNGSTNHGIVGIWYRPGRDTAGIHKTPGTYYVVSRDGYFYSFQEGSSKAERLSDGLSDGGTYTFSWKYRLLDNGCLVRPWYSGQSPSNGYTAEGIKIIDLDNRMPLYGSNLGTVTSDYYATSYQHLPAALTEFIPQSKNPNNKHMDNIVQTKSGRMFCVLEAEANSGGTRIIELFISDPDPNNFYRRSISYGDSKLFQNSNLPNNVYTDNNYTLVGNMPTAKISTNNTTALVKTRFSDVGGAFMQDTPTDAIYIRENTHLYAINPNTRSNITSYDFANQGTGTSTTASNVDPSSYPNWSGQTGRQPTAKFSEGNGSTSSSIDPNNGSAEGGYGDVEGNTTFDLIYGDDTRLYMALKMDVQRVPYHTYGGTQYYQTQNNSHCLLRFHTGKDGNTIKCGVRGPHPSPVDGLTIHPQGTSPSTANYIYDREYYYFGLLANQEVVSVSEYGGNANNRRGGNHGMFSGVNLMYDNKRNNVWVVGRRDLENCNNPTGQTNYSKMIVVPVGEEGADTGHSNSAKHQMWPNAINSYNNNEPVQAQCGQAALYGQISNIGTSQALELFYNNGASGNDKIWLNSANLSSTDTPNGFERIGVISGQAINVTMNGKTSDLQDAFHPTLPNRGSQVYFSGMSNDATQYNSSHGTFPGSNTREDNGQNWVAPIGENRIGAVPFRHSSNGINQFYNEEPGYLNSNRNHNTAINSTQDAQYNHLYHAKIKLKTTQTTAVTAANNEEGIRCVWYYKGAFHGVTTYDEGTYVYMPEPEHGNSRDGHSSSPNDNTNTVTHYVSQCESGQNSYNNVIGGSNTKIGTAEGCKNSDWAACVAPGGILCLPKQDSGYAKAGFIGINLGTKTILNTSSGSGQPFEAPSSVNPNNKQIKQMVVTSTGKIWAILDYENPSASTLQFRILQVVFNSNYSSVTWSGGLYTSQASNSNSGHVKFHRTVCGNMPQSKMEWDAV